MNNITLKRGLKSIIREDIKRFYVEHENPKGTVRFEHRYDLGEIELEVTAWRDGVTCFDLQKGNNVYYSVLFDDYALDDWERIWAAYRRKLNKKKKENLEHGYTDERLNACIDALNNY